MSVANRVSHELGCNSSGSLVGYSVRFDDRTSASTRIKYMTDGMLLREALLDGRLRRYSVIIVDEAHERTVNTDVLLGVLKALVRQRRDLRLIIMSATLQASKFQEFFAWSSRPSAQPASDDAADEMASGIASGDADLGEVPAVYVRGRQYPVKIFYTQQPEPDYLEACLLAVMQVHTDQPGDGGILVFLTGQEEIESLARLLRDRAAGDAAGGAAGSRDGSEYRGGKRGQLGLHVVCIYAALPYEDQMKVFEDPPAGTRKVVLATNIAETSLTISGMRYVIDSGLVKARSYNAKSGIQSLQVVPISRAQAAQRCGRAGRESPGVCYRLYTERTFDRLAESTVPEVKRCGLGSIVLQLKALRIDVMDFDFIDPPPAGAILKALEILLALGAVRADGELSDPLGKQMAVLPLDPMPARALITSIDHGCSEELCAVMALLSVENLFFAPAGRKEAATAAQRLFDAGDGDTPLLLRVMEAWRATPKRERHAWCREHFINKRSIEKAADIEKQLRGHLTQIRKDSNGKTAGSQSAAAAMDDDSEALRRCITNGFFMNAATRLPDGRYRCMSSGVEVHMHPTSSMFGKKADVVLFNELVETSKKYIRTITPIEGPWLIEAAPRYYSDAGLQ